MGLSREQALVCSNCFERLSHSLHLTSIYVCQERLTGAKDGCFVVRDITGYFGTIAVLHESRLFQIQIEEVDEGMSVFDRALAFARLVDRTCLAGLRLKKSELVHANLSALVQHYSTTPTPDVLPCRLRTQWP